MQIIFTNMVFVITLLTSAIAVSNDNITTKTTGERSRNSKRIRRDILELLQPNEVQSRLPVEVDLSGIVDYLAQAFEKNFTALREEFNQKLESITGNQMSVIKKPSTQNNVTDKPNDVQSTTMPMCNSNDHLAKYGIPEGETSNLRPPAEGEPAELITGFSWKSILGGCVDKSELNPKTWLLLQHRDIKRAGDFFNKEYMSYKRGFKFPSNPKIAHWIGLNTMRHLGQKERTRDVIIAYHCEGKVRCTRYAGFGIHGSDFFHVRAEVRNEGMFPNLLDLYDDCQIRSWTKKSLSSDPLLVRQNCTYDQMMGGWWWMRPWTRLACTTLCPTCYEVGASHEKIGFDASKCTHTFMAVNLKEVDRSFWNQYRNIMQSMTG